MLDLAMLQGWIPIRVEWRPTGPEVDWCYLGERTFREPFFDHTISAHLRDPYYLTSRKRTSLGELVELARVRPGLPLGGMIFHMSRCGSTLISRILAADPDNLVIAEAPPLDEVLAVSGGSSEDDRVALLRAMVAALGQQRSGRERRYFLKLDSWHIHELPLIRRAFPDVPWIFVYREPVEVIVSHQRLRGMQMAPGQIPPARLRLDPSAVGPPYNLDLFCARVLGAFCESAAQFVPAYGGLPVNYSQLPDALWTTVLPHFGVRPSPEEREALALELQYHAKYPAHPFQPDAADKLAAASPAQIALADTYVRPAYERLERLRHNERRAK
jgi:hypothetical protein